MRLQKSAERKARAPFKIGAEPNAPFRNFARRPGGNEKQYNGTKGPRRAKMRAAAFMYGGGFTPP